MDNVAVLNAVELGPAAFAQLPAGEAGGASAVGRSVAFARSLPDVTNVLALVDAGDAGRDSRDALAAAGCELVAENDWTVDTLLRVLETTAAGHDHLHYAYADCALLDTRLAETMYGNHLRYYADYTFADGYPYGLAPEILRAETVTALRRLASGSPLVDEPAVRDSLFTVLKRDINAFDLETEISPVDQRMLRISLTADTRRNQRLLAALMQHGARDAESTTAVIAEHGELLRTLPAYFAVQIVEGCPQQCSYCPYGIELDATGKQAEMPLAAFQELLAAIAELCGDAVVAVSLWGEPAYYSELPALAAAVSETPGLDLLIETSGVGWDRGVLQEATQLARPPRWIVSLDATTDALYTRLRGPGFEQAVATADWLLEHAPRHAYVQAVRMEDNEEQLEQFYRHWKAKTENVIIQKYDRFAERLPDRQVADLAPLDRHPCWHNKRDMAVLIDGTVPLCREDLDRKHVLGNALTDPLEKIWHAGHDYYLQHVRADYPELCRACDEFYTFNF